MSRPLLVALIVLVGVMVAVSQLLLRHGMRQLGAQGMIASWRMVPAAACSPWILASLVLGVATFVVYGYLLGRAEMTIIAPAINGVFYLIIFVVAAVWLRECVTGTRIAGAALLLVALWLLSRGAR